MLLVLSFEVIQIDNETAEAKNVKKRNEEKKNCKEDRIKRSMKYLAQFENKRVSNYDF
jgi:hypothetical protein